MPQKQNQNSENDFSFFDQNLNQNKFDAFFEPNQINNSQKEQPSAQQNQQNVRLVSKIFGENTLVVNW